MDRDRILHKSAVVGWCLLTFILGALSGIVYSNRCAEETRAQQTQVAKPTRAQNPPPLLKGAPLLREVQKGGYILFVRHADKSRGKIDGSAVSHSVFDYVSSMPKRKIHHPTYKGPHHLSEKGLAEAWVLGEIIKDLGIPIGRVYTSPIARCVETAELAFGKAQNESALIGTGLYSESEKQHVLDQRRALFLTEPDSGTNTVIVGHSSTLPPLGIKIRNPQSGTVVLKASNGTIKFIADLTPLDWARLLEKPAA